MAHSEAHYRAAAQGLGEGFLGSEFGRSSLPDNAVSSIHRVAAFREEAELMGLKGGSVAGVQERGMRLAKSLQDAKSAESEKAKRSADNILFLNLLDQQIAFLGNRIDAAEKSFVEQYGDAWAEELALEILDPDEIPQREEGETIEEYRERLKPLLVERMLDENGEIRPEYRDHPKYGQFAQWAKDQHDMRPLLEGRAQIDAIQSDPSLSDAQREDETREILEGMNLQELQASREIGDMDANVQALARQEADARIDERIGSSPAASTFDSFG